MEKYQRQPKIWAKMYTSKVFMSGQKKSWEHMLWKRKSKKQMQIKMTRNNMSVIPMSPKLED